MSRDARLGVVIERIGHINRAVDDGLFSSVVHHIIGQQISTKAQQTIWQRMNDAFGEVTPASIGRASIEELQTLGMTFRKAEYIMDFTGKIIDGEFDLDVVKQMADADAISGILFPECHYRTLSLSICGQRRNHRAGLFLGTEDERQQRNR